MCLNALKHVLRRLGVNKRRICLNMKRWDELPGFMQCEEVKEYYDILAKKSLSLKLKRIFDVAAGLQPHHKFSAGVDADLYEQE